MDALYKQFSKDEIFPEIIDAFTPSAQLKVVFPSTKQEVQLGNVITPADSKEQPEVYVNVNSTSKGVSYTLVMTDPDAPSRTDKQYSEFAHYLVTDIKIDSSKLGEWQQLDFSKARTILTYRGPGPPKGTGLHRYVFLLFQQLDPELVVNGPAPENRINWGYGRPGAGVRDWLKELPLDPISGNYFFAENK